MQESGVSSSTTAAPLTVGSRVPDLMMDPITRTQLALFAGASGDHNPIHLDDEEARRGGLPGVITHGMLTMAFLGEFVERLAGRDNLRHFDARFVAMAQPGDQITCAGEVAARDDEAGEHLVTVNVTATNQAGTKVAEGVARFSAK